MDCSQRKYKTDFEVVINQEEHLRGYQNICCMVFPGQYADDMVT